MTGGHARFLADAGLSAGAGAPLDITVGRLIDAIRGHDRVHPVLSGQTGAWGPIWSGRAPKLAHVRAATADLRVARPLIHAACLTSNPYRPGWVLRGGREQRLPLVTPAGLSDWLNLEPDPPRFVPWTWGVVDGRPVNLTDLHGRPTRHQAPVAVVFDAELLWHNKKLVGEWLTAMFSRCPEGDLTWLFGRGVARDATVGPLRMRRTTKGFSFSTTGPWVRLGSAETLTELCMLPYRVVAEPRLAEEIVRHAPAVVPLMSPRLVKTLMGYLGAASDLEDEPDALLVEWGSLGQAGYPPVRAGYFAGRTSRRAARLIAIALADANGLPPLIPVMLPITPMLLMPTSAFPSDARMLAPFLGALRHLDPDTSIALKQAASLFAETAPRPSSLYRSRFNSLAVADVPDVSAGFAETIELGAVRDLTLRQASIAVATFIQAWSATA